MLAGLTRIVEVCFIVPSFDRESPAVDSDRHSDRTLGPSNPPENPRLYAVQAFRHLPPFVSLHTMMPHLFFVLTKLAL